MVEVQEEARGLCVVEVTGFLAVPEGMVVSGRFQGCEEESLVEYLQGHLDSGQLRLLLSRDHGSDGDMLQQGLLRVQCWRNRAGSSFPEAWRSGLGRQLVFCLPGHFRRRRTCHVARRLRQGLKRSLCLLSRHPLLGGLVLRCLHLRDLA